MNFPPKTKNVVAKQPYEAIPSKKGFFSQKAEAAPAKKGKKGKKKSNRTGGMKVR